jgi:hypothetical protein
VAAAETGAAAGAAGAANSASLTGPPTCGGVRRHPTLLELVADINANPPTPAHPITYVVIGAVPFEVRVNPQR